MTTDNNNQEFNGNSEQDNASQNETKNTGDLGLLKEKLEELSVKLGAYDEAKIQKLYEDISALKEATKNVEKNIESVHDIKDANIKTAEMSEMQKYQLDMALKNNESILNAVSKIQTAFDEMEKSIEDLKANQKINSKLSNNERVLSELELIKNAAMNLHGEAGTNASGLKNQIEQLHFSLKDYIERLLKKTEEIPSINDIGAVVSDINGIQQKNIAQTNVLIQDLKEALSGFEKDFKNKNFDSQINKIAEIYENLNIINEWVEKVGYINRSIENVYSRLGENIDFDDVAEKIDIIYENITALNSWTMKLDNTETAVSGIKDKLYIVSDMLDKNEKALAIIENVKQKLETVFASEPDFEDITNKIDIVYENLSAMNEWAQKADNISAGISDLKNTVETGNVASKVEEIAKNSVQNLENDEYLMDKLNEISETTKRAVSSDETHALNQKLNDLHIKTDMISDKLENSGIDAKLREFSQFISDKLENLKFGEKLDEFSESITGKLENIKLGEKLDEFSNNLSEQLNDNALDVKIGNISDKLSDMNETFDNEMLFTKIDVIYENVGLLNEWVLKLDSLEKESKTGTDEIKSEIAEISQCIANLKNSVYDFTQTKELLEGVSSEVKKITSKRANDEGDYVYSLLDVEADLMKINKALESNTEVTSLDIAALKNSFADVAEDISSISIRTNKLILTADDANKEFQTCIGEFKDSLNAMDRMRIMLNPDEKLALIDSKLADLSSLAETALNANNNLNTALAYLADWVDNAGKVITSVDETVANIKSAQDNQNIIQERTTDSVKENNALISALKEDIAGVTASLSFTGEVISSMDTSLTKLTSNVDVTVKSADEIKERISSFEEKTAALFSTLANATDGVLADMRKGLSSENNDIKEEIKSAKEDISSKLSEISTASGEYRENAKTEIISAVNALKEKAAENATEITECVKTGVENTSNRLEKIAKSADAVVEALSGFDSGLAALLNNAGKTVDANEKITESTNEIKEGLSAVAKHIRILLKQNQLKLQETDELKNETTALSENVQNVINLLNGADEKFNGFANTLQEIKSKKADFAEIISYMGELSKLLKNIKDTKPDYKVITDKISSVEDNFETFKNEDISELKSMMTGVAVQIGTAVRPDIEALNDKIDKLSEANDLKFDEFKNSIKSIIDKQEARIAAFEDKFEKLNAKFDKLVEVIGEDNRNYEVKDILNYIATQITSTNEKVTEKMSYGNLIKEVADKVSGFDASINKVVSYIEEE